jgi:hypothetical protein
LPTSTFRLAALRAARGLSRRLCRFSTGALATISI